jgi:hypothetical protein
MKLSVEEEDLILRRMKMNGETNKSAHLKRIYFEHGGVGELTGGDIARKIDVLSDNAQALNDLLEKLVEMHKTPVDHTIAAAIFMLLYPSVPQTAQAQVDKYIDMRGIEAILKGRGR